MTTVTTNPATGLQITRRMRTNTRVWAGSSVGFDAFVRGNEAGTHNNGVIPGVGYGVKWGRRPATPTDNPTPWIAVDVFMQGALEDESNESSGSDYFNVDILPVVTLFNWVSVGWGPRLKYGLNGLPDERSTLFSFGLRKAI